MLQLKEEILSAHQQLKTLCGQLRQGSQRLRRNSTESLKGSTSSEDDYTINSVHVGFLNDIVLELKGLVHGMLRRGMQNNNLPLEVASCDENLLKMEADLHRTTENCEKLSITLRQNEMEIKRKDEEIADQQSRVRNVPLPRFFRRLMIDDYHYS